MPRKARVDVIRGIQAVGYLTEIDTTHLLNLPKLTIESNLINSMAFGLGSGTGLILELRMLADRPTHIAEFGDLSSPGRPGASTGGRRKNRRSTNSTQAWIFPVTLY